MTPHDTTSFRLNIATLVVAAGLLSAACGDGYVVPDKPVGALGATTTKVFGDDGALIDRHADSDGDGIADGDELDGWLITVDSAGYAALVASPTDPEAALEQRHVSSDPRFADTDGDGLSDGEERAVKCDPRRRDTDGDTLSDADELQRFGTSPASVDTDGDARGGGTTARPPLFQLFDGGELRLEPDPENPDGPWIIGPGATCPFLPDSDGDGVNDYEETLASRRRPNVADIPKMKLFATPGAVIDMYLHTELADGTEDSSTYGTSTVIDESGFVRNRTSTEIIYENSTYAATYLTEKADAGCCLNIAKSETEVGVILDHTTTLTQTVTTETELGFAVNANHIMNEAQSAQESHALTITGGAMRTSLDLENDGTVTVRVENLVIGVRRFDRFTSRYVPVAELAASSGITLAPHERRTVFVANEDITLQPMLDLFADPRSLAFTASRYDLVDQDGEDFDFTMAEVRNATAAIEIDNGVTTDKFWVAAYADPENGISIGQALGEIGIDFEAVPVDADGQPGVEGWKVRIGTRDTEFWTEPADDLGDTLPYTLSGGPGPRLVKRGWYGYVKRFDADNDDGTFYENLFDAPLWPGDLVTLVYSQDLDRDGLSAAEEQFLGSSDATAQSDADGAHPDGDGLSDFWEAREGWTVEWAGRAPYRVFSSPAAIDTDGDGLADNEEVAIVESGTGTDPWMADTDLDGRSDLFEHQDTLYGLDPLAQQLQLPPPTVTCTIETRHNNNASVVIYPSGDIYYVLTAGANDAEGDLVSLTVNFLALDAVAPTFSTPVGSMEVRRAFDQCVDPANYSVTATDALGLHATAACKWRVVQGDDFIIEDACETENQPYGPTWGGYEP